MPATIYTAVGPPAFAALNDAVARIKADDRFARIVVVADHHDAARAVSHLLGAQDAGLVNVSLQTGRRLASELAGGTLSTLPLILEGAAVRTIADRAEAAQGLEPVGRSRFYHSLTQAFRNMAERPALSDDADTADAPDNDMNRLAEKLYAEYRQMLKDKGNAVAVQSFC